MAIEKVNEDINLEIEPNSEAQIALPGMENNAMMMEDGSAIVNPMPDISGRGAFNANLAEIIPDDTAEPVQGARGRLRGGQGCKKFLAENV